MSNNNFTGLIRFVGTKANYDSLNKTGKLVFAQITGAAEDVASYYIYANDREFAFNSYDQFKSLKEGAIQEIIGDNWIDVTVKGDTEKKTYNIAAKITSIKDAVGMTKNEDGTWSSADGTVTDGLVSAADVAAEIVADEQVIAAALNDHESRIKVIEDTLTWSIIE